MKRKRLAKKVAEYNQKREDSWCGTPGWAWITDGAPYFHVRCGGWFDKMGAPHDCVASSETNLRKR